MKMTFGRILLHKPKQINSVFETVIAQEQLTVKLFVSLQKKIENTRM